MQNVPAAFERTLHGIRKAENLGLEHERIAACLFIVAPRFMVQSYDLRGRLKHKHLVDEGFAKDTMGLNILNLIPVKVFARSGEYSS